MSDNFALELAKRCYGPFDSSYPHIAILELDRQYGIVCQALVDTHAKLDEATAALEKIRNNASNEYMNESYQYYIALRALAKIKKEKP